MESFPINWWALLVATLVKFVLGFVWFGVVFGKKWQALTGLTEESMKAGMAKAIVADLVTTFIMAWVLVHAVHYAGATTWGMGAGVGFFNWLGFIGAPTLAAILYEKRPLMLWLINNGYQLIALIVMGAIVAIWT
jgi:uncharacterized protein DUF1761